MVFVATNQLRDQIGGMTGFGAEKGEALLGGDAQRFNSTYQFKVARVKDILTEDHMGVKRKGGSTHILTAKRNKLGREGNSQKVEWDRYIKGGSDWWSPLIRKLGDEYPALVGKTGGWYTWRTENVEYVLDVEGEQIRGTIDPAKKFRETDLAMLVRGSEEAKEMCRTAFGIPDMPTVEVQEEIEKVNKTRKKKKSELELEDEPYTQTTENYE
jgi:hypothetical protein